MLSVFLIMRQPCYYYFLLQQSTIMIPVVSRSCVYRWGTRCTYLRNWKVSEAEHKTCPDTSPSFLSSWFELTQELRWDAAELAGDQYAIHNNVNESTYTHCPPDRLHCHHSYLIHYVSLTVIPFSINLFLLRLVQGLHATKEITQGKGLISAPLSYNHCCYFYLHMLIVPHCFLRAFSQPPTST